MYSKFYKMKKIKTQIRLLQVKHVLLIYMFLSSLSSPTEERFFRIF
jgi:hypothetical protein